MPPGPAAATDSQVRETYAYFADGTRLPLFSTTSDSAPVARVGPDTITLQDLTDALATIHQERAKGAEAGDKDLTAVLDRLISARLALVEAESMGITDLPQFKSSVENYRRGVLAETLRAQVGSAAQADPAEVKRVYEKTVREYRIRSVTFFKAEDAVAFQTAIKSGGDFDTLARDAAASGKAGTIERSEFLLGSKMLPQVREAVRALPTGRVSAPLRISKGWAVFEVMEERPGSDPAELARIEAGLQSATRVEILRKYYESLLKKYATVDRKLLKSLNFDVSKAKLDGFAKDRRPLARIQGEPPITVAELLAQIDKRFFHGLEEAAKQKKINARKQVTLDDMLERRLFLKEAFARQLDKDPAFVRRIREYGDKIVFAAVVERAVLPSVRVTEEEAKAFYSQHTSEFSTPAMVRLNGLAFADPALAESAIQKARAGTDFGWLAANASGRADKDKEVMEFDKALVTLASLPPGLSSALAGAREGEYRLYVDPSGVAYVVQILQQVAPAPQPFETAKTEIGNRLYNQKANAAFEEWVGKLRQHYKPEILIIRIGK